MESDFIDKIIAMYRLELPKLDVASTHVVGRILRIHNIFNQDFSHALSKQDTSPGAYRVLAALFRAGKPYQLSPSQLLESLMVTSGGMTNLLTRMEKEGQIQRLPDPKDKRGILVTLTKQGREKIESLIPINFKLESKILMALSKTEQKQLATLLKKILLDLE